MQSLVVSWLPARLLMVMLMLMVMVVASWWTRQQLTLTAKQVQKSTCCLGRRQLRASTLQVGQAANNIAISRVEPPSNALLLLLLRQY